VIVSPKEYNVKVGLCLCCPITSRVKGYPFELALPPDTGISGAVLCDQVKSLDWKARNARLAASLPVSLVREIQARIMALIQ
jgi:mRNA interferase MazF